MPFKHQFAEPGATHGRSLCGLDVRPPSPLITRPRRRGACRECERAKRRLDKNAPRANARRSYHDRLAED